MSKEAETWQERARDLEELRHVVAHEGPTGATWRCGGAELEATYRGCTVSTVDRAWGINAPTAMSAEQRAAWHDAVLAALVAVCRAQATLATPFPELVAKAAQDARSWATPLAVTSGDEGEGDDEE